MSFASSTYAPDRTKQQQDVQSSSRQTSGMSVCDIVSIVYCWQQTPAAVYLRVILIDFGD